MRDKFLLVILLAVVAYVLYDYFSGGSLSSSIVGNGIPQQNFPGIPQQLIQDFSQSIASAEGYGVPNAIPTKANNPGDLELGDLFGLGVLGQGITVFPDATTGWEYLYNQVGIMLSGQSSHYQVTENFTSVGATYAGDSVAWPANVVSQLIMRGYNIGIGNTLQDLVNEANA